MRIVLAFTVVAALAGCAPMTPTLVELKTPFNELVTQIPMRPGKNEITGSAFMRRNDGNLVTCAGHAVDLIPVTDYSTERMIMLYGSAESGLQRPLRPGSIVPATTPDAYKKLRYTTTCDVRGEFEFLDIADGDWFITAPVVWMAGAVTQGGYLMKRVTVEGGQHIKTVLTR